MAPGRTDVIIAGVNKAGTTSLFVSLSTHPDIAPSSVKETRFFLPARYGSTLPSARSPCRMRLRNWSAICSASRRNWTVGSATDRVSTERR